MDNTVFTDRAGNEYTIVPFCHARVLDATRYLRKEKGLVVSADDTGFEKSIEFQVALANALLTWTLGSLAGAQWDQLALPATLLLLGVLWLVLQARALNALLTGDETAGTLGINPHALRRVLFVVISLITGTMVAVSGAIGFVGLVIPHITRMLVGWNIAACCRWQRCWGRSFWYWST